MANDLVSIRRREDGSINYCHYNRRAYSLRSQAIFDILSNYRRQASAFLVFFARREA
jgi:hypothetical protein